MLRLVIFLIMVAVTETVAITETVAVITMVVTAVIMAIVTVDIRTAKAVDLQVLTHVRDIRTGKEMETVRVDIRTVMVRMADIRTVMARAEMVVSRTVMVRVADRADLIAVQDQDLAVVLAVDSVPVAELVQFLQ